MQFLLAARFNRLAFAGALLAFAGCSEQPGDTSASAASDEERAQVLTEGPPRDMEAPEVFQAAANGLWDGRPSLGGIWVAHPDVDTPERVIVRNDETGASVVGALFRRERENPGPPFQVSSDAADALGMLAGAPAPLEVTALRRMQTTAEDPEIPPEPGDDADNPVADADTRPAPPPERPAAG